MLDVLHSADDEDLWANERRHQPGRSWADKFGRLVLVSSISASLCLNLIFDKLNPSASHTPERSLFERFWTNQPQRLI